MCLTIYDNFSGETKVANKPIIVYKTGEIISRSEFKTPFMNYIYKIGEIQPSKSLNSNYFILSTLESEGYHSYRLLEDVIHKVPKFSSWEFNMFIIPKGAEYVEGINHDGTNGYVSSTIVRLGHRRNPITWLRLLMWKFKGPV